MTKGHNWVIGGALLVAAALLWPGALGVASAASEEPEKATKSPEKKAPGEKEAEDKWGSMKDALTEGEVLIGGQAIPYQACAGMLPIRDEQGKVTAEIFYVAYTRSDIPEGEKRPLTFSFNGGPGSSSVWMHLGLLGPKRVKLAEGGFAVAPPYELVANEFSLLDETDLVFIDPVGTGFSRAQKPEEAKNFHGVAEDARSVAEFIRLYVTRHERWASPKFLIGESYGTTRAAALSGELLHKHRMNLNGIMLVSTVLNFQTIWGGAGNDLPHVLYLPSFCATAWYHKKLSPELQARDLPDLLKEVEAFAIGDYNRGLMLGAGLKGAERADLVRRVAAYLGLKESFVEGCNLRVSMRRFNAELLRAEGRVIGRFDSRYTSPVRDELSEGAERDPSADAIFSAFASTFMHYLRTDLKVTEDQPYHILAGLGRWNWGAENQFLNVAETLADSMVANPFLKVHVSNGLYDLATPYFAARYTFDHLVLPEVLHANIVQDDYTAGHMMYLNLPDLEKQKKDLAAFIRSASGHE
jgi:carboxypeptidase C (cathepsin A)